MSFFKTLYKVGGGETAPITINRNNTNFPVRLFELLKGVEFSDEYSFLKYYQNIVRFYVRDVDTGAKGLLVNFTMGMGKSMIAVALAIDLMDSGYEPIMLLTKSLQGNMKGAIMKYINFRRGVDPQWKIGLMGNAELREWIDKNFSFVSMNASNMLEQMTRATVKASKWDKPLEKKLAAMGEINLKKKVLIIDEAHNFFRAITNGSKNALGLYDKIMGVKDMKLVFLTGTPINNSPFELVPCYNMLAGDIVLPESWRDFNKLFVDPDTKHIKNVGKFQNRIMGLTSYVSHTSTVGAATGREIPHSKAEFPEEYPVIVERVKFDEDTWGAYQIARDKEREEGQKPGAMGGPSRGLPVEAPRMQKPKSGASSSYRVNTRQFSNYVPPPTSGAEREKDINNIPPEFIRSSKLDKIYENILRHDNQLGLVYSQFVGIGGLEVFRKYLELRGYKYRRIDTKKLGGSIDSVLGRFGGRPEDRNIIVERANEKHIEKYSDISVRYGAGILKSQPFTVMNARYSDDDKNNSRGITVAIDDAYSDDNKVVLYSSAENKDIDAFLHNTVMKGAKIGGDPVVAVKPAPRQKYYTVISGDVTVEEREALQEMFNSDENKHGGLIDLILVSSTGAEGLDLKNIRHIHVMEPYWNYSRIAQIRARGVRNDSHISLPPAERNVQTYIYLAVKPDSSTSTEPTTDEELYEDSVKDQISIESFVAALRGVSIECALNKGEGCRLCNPTNTPLYGTNIIYDVERAPDPCHALVEKTVQAQEVMLGEDKYYYRGEDIFKFDPDLKSYVRMSPADPNYDKILSAIGVDDIKLPF
jgi:superfamily II DNA or RNA helicase